MLKTIKTIIITLTLCATMLATNANAADPAIKKSKTNICHEKTSMHYANTKNFTPFDSMAKCVASGGRAAKPLNITAGKAKATTAKPTTKATPAKL